MAIDRFGLIREEGFGTWHGPLGTAPHLEQCGLLGLDWASIFSLAFDNYTVFLSGQVNFGLKAWAVRISNLITRGKGFCPTRS